MGPKKQDFGQESIYWKEIWLGNELMMNYGSSKSAILVLSKSIFYIKNQPNLFEKKINLEISI